MADRRAENILQVLKENLAMPNWTVMRHEPFETLIATIISQNTADVNTERAFENLSKQFEVTPQSLSQAETSKLEACLHVGGLYKSKAKTIQAVSKIILEKFKGSLKPILWLPLEEARKRSWSCLVLGRRRRMLFCFSLQISRLFLWIRM